MNNWASGYVADIDYTAGFYEHMTPVKLAFALLTKGFSAPDIIRPYTYCELGCGHGVTVNVMGAANPQGDFWATDFNPSQIANARKLASAACLDNVHFFDSSFGEFNSADLPQFDFITLHGIWTWVSEENRREIVTFIRDRLKVGGVVYVSYNALPGWAPILPLRRLLTDHAPAGGEPTLTRIRNAIDFADSIRNAGALFFQENPAAAERIEDLKTSTPKYLAHEYFPEGFDPAYHADVARDFSEAKLRYVCPADVIQQIDALNMDGAQIELLSKFENPVQRETVRDYLLNTRFRRDIFVKGPLALNEDEARERWMGTRFAMKVDRSEAPTKIKGPLGDVELHPEVYGPVLDALARGPQTVAQLLEDPAIASLGLARLQQALTVLVGSRPIDPCLDAENDSLRIARARDFNTAALRQAQSNKTPAWLACPVTGSGLSVEGVLQLFLLARRLGRDDLIEYAWGEMSLRGARLLKEGVAIESDADNLAEMRVCVERFLKNPLPVFQQLGLS